MSIKCLGFDEEEEEEEDDDDGDELNEEDEETDDDDDDDGWKFEAFSILIDDMRFDDSLGFLLLLLLFIISWMGLRWFNIDDDDEDDDDEVDDETESYLCLDSFEVDISGSWL